MAIIRNNIIYDSKNNLATDIYYPNDTSSSTKILIFWHGGGWFRGNKESVKSLGISLANAGFMTFIPEYRLAPANLFPAAHDDALHFADWLLHSQYTDAGDEENIVQIGASVGGTMALEVAGKYGFPTVTWSAPVEFSNWIKNHQDVKASPAGKDELGLTKRSDINQAFYKYFTLTYTGTSDSQVLQKLDVMHYDLTKLDKLMMINSADELTPLSSVLDFIKFLAAKQHEIELLVIKGHGHAMDYGIDYLDESLDFLYQTIKRQK
ncbi:MULTISPECIES: alpha/beta hydrolase fold domain-containing protein [Lactobacillus]|uniref:Alpha/beta hydrolase n=1 Tax=Lactobacillus xujianguonis TaxID=2495899 RepID=A0A437ST74_9LACO|nr:MULTISPECIES: alpha/beta hydrolase fold domain-containing protein [Lactobacillus]RVU70130.1 alpha/beta hydrolase [Lactobacillus xujianguonis]RVU73348.1 alpha/beta hydrolase [Lactobacillus xujianguonis]